MRFLASLVTLALAVLPSVLGDQSKWIDLASKSKNGIIKLDSAMYDELLASDRDYSALVLLTALAPQFKCQPCQYVNSVFESGSRQADDIATSSRRLTRLRTLGRGNPARSVMGISLPSSTFKMDKLSIRG